jgi:hypothetical protein
VPYWHGEGTGTSFAVMTTADQMALATAIRAAIRTIDAELALSAWRTMDEVIKASVAQRRFQTNLVVFGAAATILGQLSDSPTAPPPNRIRITPSRLFDTTMSSLPSPSRSATATPPHVGPSPIDMTERR